MEPMPGMCLTAKPCELAWHREGPDKSAVMRCGRWQTFRFFGCDICLDHGPKCKYLIYLCLFFFKHAFFQVVLVQFDSSRLEERKHS